MCVFVCVTNRRLIKAIPRSVIVDLDGRFIFAHRAAANQQQRRLGAQQGFRENDRTHRKHITYVTVFFFFYFMIFCGGLIIRCYFIRVCCVHL